MNNPKFDRYKMISQYLYEYTIENELEWPCTSCKWGPVLNETSEYGNRRSHTQHRNVEL